MGLKEKYAADNPANTVRPGLRFAFSHPAHAIALFFGAGCIRPAPGTWGTLAGVLVWIALVQCCSWKVLFALIGALYFLGIWASEKTSIDLGVEDAGAIVIDEVVAVWLVMLMFPQGWATWIGAFVAFRFFDIIKFPPAGLIERKMHGGMAVMADDIAAALWAIVALVLCDKAAGLIGFTFLGLFS